MDSEPALDALVDRLQRRHGGAVCAVLMYGSCLRSGNIFDGLVDLYLVCDNYGQAYGHSFLAVANRVLPPNVFYAEHNQDGRVLRSKVTVISMADFRRGCSPTSGVVSPSRHVCSTAATHSAQRTSKNAC
jgi:hypothetical protein